MNYGAQYASMAHVLPRHNLISEQRESDWLTQILIFLWFQIHQQCVVLSYILPHTISICAVAHP